MAIAAMCEALGKSGKPFVCANGTLMTDGETEESPKLPIDFFPRWKSEHLTSEYASKGVRATTIRLPPIVHGPGHYHPFITTQIDVAKGSGEAGYIGEGDQVWPSVHVDDAADLFVLALEKGEKGKIYHAVAEEGIKVKTLAEAIAGKLGRKTKSLTKEEVAERYGFIGALMDMSNKTTSDLTRKWLGWEPKQYGLLEELENYSY